MNDQELIRLQNQIIEAGFTQEYQLKFSGYEFQAFAIILSVLQEASPSALSYVAENSGVASGTQLVGAVQRLVEATKRNVEELDREVQRMLLGSLPDAEGHD